MRFVLLPLCLTPLFLPSATAFRLRAMRASSETRSVNTTALTEQFWQTQEAIIKLQVKADTLAKNATKAEFEFLGEKGKILGSLKAERTIDVQVSANKLSLAKATKAFADEKSAEDNDRKRAEGLTKDVKKTGDGVKKLAELAKKELSDANKKAMKSQEEAIWKMTDSSSALSVDKLAERVQKDRKSGEELDRKIYKHVELLLAKKSRANLNKLRRSVRLLGGKENEESGKSDQERADNDMVDEY